MKILADHCEGECRWPLETATPRAWGSISSDTSQQPFCCDPVEPGEVYCPGHCWDAYPRTRRGPRPDPFNDELVALLPQLGRFAAFLTRDPAAGEDLMHDTVEKALRYREQFQLGTNMKAWLFFICRNAFLSKRPRARKAA